MTRQTFVYSPDVKVLISDTETYDLSEDIINFSVQRSTSSISTASITLHNRRNKYNNLLKRMSRIVIFLKRTEWVQVFAGYTDSVPYLQIVPGPVTIKASCSIKRIQHTHWDPAKHPEILYQTLRQNANQPDGGTSEAVFRTLIEIAGWDESHVHIQKIPQVFLEFNAAITTENEDDIQSIQPRKQMYEAALGQFAHTGGVGTTGGRVDLGDASDRAAFVARAVKAANWPEELWVTAIAVALAESGGDPMSVGDNTAEKLGQEPEPGEQSTGLFQVHYRPSRDAGNPIRDPANNYDPIQNAKNAYEIYKGAGSFQPWSVHELSSNYPGDGHPASYKNYLAEAAAGANRAQVPSLPGSQSASMSGRVGVLGWTDKWDLAQYSPGAAYKDETPSSPQDHWYCAMRFTQWDEQAGRCVKDVDAFKNWAAQKIRVTSVDKPQNSFVLRPVHTGPNPRTGLSISVSEQVLRQELKLGIGDDVQIEIAPFDHPLGPYVPREGESTGTPVNPTAGNTSSPNTEELIQLLLAQQGDTYTQAMDRIPDPNDPDPDAFDCSRLIDWGMARLGLDFPAPSGNQISILRKAGTNGMSIEQALQTRGALLYRLPGLVGAGSPGHVAISLGDGTSTMEARSTKLGVGVFTGAEKRIWSDAGYIPTLNYVGIGTPVDLPGLVTGPDGGAVYPGQSQSPFTLNLAWEAVYKDTMFLPPPRSFLNAESVLQTTQMICKASMREFQSGPNGDFVAWFPDWYGLWGKTPTMMVEDIEIVDFNIDLSDDSLITHLAVTGDTLGAPDGIATHEWFRSRGFLTIEDPAALRFLFQLPTKIRDAELDASGFLQRFGLRPMVEEIPEIRSHEWESMYAAFRFLKAWASQFKSTVSFTFMPELYPGMIIRLRSHGLQVYVESVSHTGSRNGGFQTTAVVTAPVDVSGGAPAGIITEELGIDTLLSRPDNNPDRFRYNPDPNYRNIPIA